MWCKVLSIFILEDNVIQAQSMKRAIEHICSLNHIPYNFIETTSRYEEILSKISQCTYTPIYFLDIEIKNEERKGLEVAQEIRKLDSQGLIVFVTTHSELAPISYQYMVSALTFIDKNQPYPKRLELLESCLKHYESLNGITEQENYFFVENAFTSIKVPFHSVEYIMTDEPHRLKLVTTNQLIQFYGTLKEIEQSEPRLVRCHKSYVVNEMNIQGLEIQNQQLILKSGKKIPVSRRLMKPIKALLKEC